MRRRLAVVVAIVAIATLAVAPAASAGDAARKATGTFGLWEETTVCLSVHGAVGEPGEPGYRPAKGYIAFMYDGTVDILTVADAWFDGDSCSFTLMEDENTTFTVNDNGVPGKWDMPDDISAITTYPDSAIGWAVVIDWGNITVH